MPPFTLHSSLFTLLHDWSAPHPTELSRAIARRRDANLPITDLITANPQEHGILCDPALVERALLQGHRDTALYRPDPRGQPHAREAIAQWHGATSADHVLLTPGTSLAYLYLFRLLAERAEILCPTPTYPLFDDLARIAGANVRRYHLALHDNRWTIDPEEIAFQVTPNTRLLVLVSPHNPTGHVVTPAQLHAIAAIARRHDLAIIFDEVFRDTLHTVDNVSRPSEYDTPLTLTLSGLSKRLALPGLKAGWIVAQGDPSRRDPLLNALEYLSDTFLPVSEPVQGALPILLREGEPEAQRLAAIHRARMRETLHAARDAGFDTPTPDGGIYVLLPLPETCRGREQQRAIQLLDEEGLLLHPGTLYNITQPHLVSTTIHPDTPASMRRILRKDEVERMKDEG